MGVPNFTLVQKVLYRAFYRREASITIYTEDSIDSTVFYEIVFRRLLEGKVKVNKVITLGPKKEVIVHSTKNPDSESKSLFIVDGDLDLMFGEEYGNSRLLMLRKYCIENYLFCEKGIVEFLYVQLGKSQAECSKMIDWKELSRSLEEALLNYYVTYAITWKLKCGAKLRHIQFFCVTQKSGLEVSSVLINQEAIRLEKLAKKKIHSAGTRAYAKEFNRMRDEIINRIDRCTSRIDFISGKDALLPWLIEVLSKHDRTVRQSGEQVIKRRLAEKIDLSELRFVRDKIDSILKN